MKQVFEHIERKSAEYTREPLFGYLSDPAIGARDKLKLVPSAAHFIMTFADICQMVLRVDPPRDRYEALINAQTAEESAHWRWYLADLTSLGMDPTLRFTDALRFLWSDQTTKTRALAYELCKLCGELDSLERLVMVQATEATGRITIEALTRVGTELEGEGHKLVFFGSRHLESELAHTLDEDEVRASLEAIALDAARRTQLCQVVDRVFEHFRGFAEDSLRIARSGTALAGRAAGADQRSSTSS